MKKYLRGYLCFLPNPDVEPKAASFKPALLLPLLFFSLYIHAQSPGDFRSIASGNWDDQLSWQTYNGSSWIAASSTPGDAVNSNVLIQDGTVIHVNVTPANAIGDLTVGQGAGGSLEFDVNNGNLTVNGAALVHNGAQVNFTSGGSRSFVDLTIESGGTWSSGSSGFTISGDVLNSGTFTAGTGTYTLIGAANTISGAISFGKLEVTGIYTNAAALTVVTALSGTGTLVQAMNATLTLGGTTTIANLNASAHVPNLVIYNNKSSQALKQAVYYDVLIQDSAKVTMPAGKTTVLNDITINQGATLSLLTGALALNGTLTNNGTVAANNLSSSIILQGVMPQTLSGKFANNQISNLTLNNEAGAFLDFGARITRGITLTKGDLASDSIITLGGGGVNTFSHTCADGIISAVFALNYGTGGNSFTYSGTQAQQTIGTEFDGNVSVLTLNNPFGLVVTKAITVTTLNLTSGILHASPFVVTVKGTNANSITGGSATAYVNGSLARSLPASVVPGSICAFPVGKSAYQLFELVNAVVNEAGVVTVTVQDANSGGAPGFALATLNANRYWSALPAPADFIKSTTVRFTEGNAGVANTLGQSETLNGTYTNVGGKFSGQKISSFSLDPALGYFVLAVGGTIAPGSHNVGNARPLNKLSDVAAILNTVSLTGNVIFEMQSDYDGKSGEVFPVVFNKVVSSGGNWTVTIRPAAGIAPRITSGDPGSSNSLVSFDGGSGIIIDGRAGGTGSSIGWIFRNKRTAATVGPVFRFVNDASNNTLTYLQVEGQNTAPASGTIVIGASTGTSGNDFNTISNSIISNRSDTSGVPAPANAIYAQGSAGADNDHSSVLNNNIFNFTASGITAAASATAGGAGQWTISGNSFYSTLADVTAKNVINLIPGNYPGNGGNVIADNFIGGSAPLSGGADWNNSGNVAFNAITLAVDAIAATSVQNNKIRNIHMNGTGASLLTGIGILGGAVNAGTATGNSIDSITVAGSGGFRGIYSSPATAAPENIANNTIAEVDVTNTLTAGMNAGIWADAGVNTITGNTIYNLSSANGSTATGASPSVIGISAGSTAANQDISKNVIHSLSNTNTAAAVKVTGIYFSGPATGVNTVSKNFIHNFSTLSSAMLSQQTGIHAVGGSAVYSNNMISLGIDPAGAAQTVTPVIVGMEKSGTGNMSFYHNSVYIGGAGVDAAAANTHAFRRIGIAAASDVVKNNIFVNARSNSAGGGKHYALSLDTTIRIASDYNLLHVSGAGGVLAAGGNTDYTTFFGWLATGKDSNSVSGDPVFEMPDGSAASADLHIKTGVETPVESRATPAGNTDDINEELRDAQHPDIGADEGGFTCMPPAAAGLITGSDSVCAGETRIFSLLPVQGAASYLWNVPAAATILNGQNKSSITVTFGPTAGNVSVTPLNVCAGGAAANFNVVVKATPITAITALPGASICKGEALTLSGTGADTYSWTGGVSDAVAFAPAATATYTVTGTGANGCSSKDTITVAVKPVPTVNASATPSATICEGASLTLSGSGATSYNWSGGVSNGVAFKPAASDIYTVIGTSANGCTGTSTVAVALKPLPAVDALSSADTVCGGTSVILNGAGAVSYVWAPVVINGTAFVPTVTRTYTVTGTGANGCKNTDTVMVAVKAQLKVKANASPAVAICEGSSVTLSGTGAASYSWSDDVLNGVAFVPVFASATYTVTGTAANSCSDSDTITITVKAVPAVNAITSEDTVCGGTAVTLTTTGDAATYTWTAGVVNGTSFTPTVTRTYTVTGTAINGCKNTDTVTVIVKPLLNVLAKATPSAAICEGSSVTLSGSGAVSYSWSGGIANGTAFKPDSTATYIVTGTAPNSCDNSDTITITLKPLPVVEATASADSVCGGTEATVTGSGAVSYTWAPGVINGTPFKPTITRTYTVTGTAVNGCKNTDTVRIAVKPAPPVDIKATPAASVCIGTSVALKGTGAVSYEWSTGSTTDTIFVQTGTTTSFTVTGTGANGCLKSDVLTVTIKPLPTVGFTISPASTVCEGTPVTVSGTGAVSYIWSNGVKDTLPFVPSGTRTYTVTGTTNGCKNIDTVTITVNPAPAVGITADPLSATVCEGSSVTLTGTGADTYVWSGGITDGVSFVPAATDTFFVTGTGGPDACTKTVSMTVTVNPYPIAATITQVLDTLKSSAASGNKWFRNDTLIPGATKAFYIPVKNADYTVEVTENGCSTLSAPFTMTSVGVNELAMESIIAVYPNPANEWIIIGEGFTSKTSSAKLSICNVLGETVMSDQLRARQSQTTINVSSLAAGLYVVKIETEEGRWIGKFVKE